MSPGGVRRGSLRISFAGPLAGRRNSGIVEDRSRLPGRGTVTEVRRGERLATRASDRTKEIVHKFRVRFGREKRASRLPFFSLDLGNVRRNTSESVDVNLTIFIASVSCSESRTSFTDRFLHFNRPPGLRMAFDGAERNRRCGRIQC